MKEKFYSVFLKLKGMSDTNALVSKFLEESQFSKVDGETESFS